MRFLKPWERYGIFWPRYGLYFEDAGAPDEAGDASGGGEGNLPGGADAPSGGDQGTPEPHFRQFIPEEAKGEAFWEAVPDDATLVKNYINQQKLIGKKGIIPPGENATAEEWQEFFNAVPRPGENATPEVKAAYKKFMGSPEAAEAYNEALVIPEDFPKEFVQEGLLEDYKQAAFEAGVPPEHAKAMFEWYIGKSKDSLGAMPEMVEVAPGYWRNEKLFLENQAKVIADLKTELGDTYNPTIARTQATVMRYGGQELADLLNQTGLGDHPAMIKTFQNFAESVSEDKTIDRGEFPQGGAAGLQADLDAISRDPALLDVKDPRHKEVEAKRYALMQKLHPDKPEE